MYMCWVHSTVRKDEMSSLQLLSGGEYIPLSGVDVLQATEKLKVLQRRFMLEQVEEEGL